jgi:hypothetical protein
MIGSAGGACQWGLSGSVSDMCQRSLRQRAAAGRDANTARLQPKKPSVAGRLREYRYSQPFARAMRDASTRFAAPSLPMASDK